MCLVFVFQFRTQLPLGFVFQVAEMHGELIEFNERLHRALMAKEALVSQMRQELIDLRGPVRVCVLRCGVLLWNKLKTITRDEIKYILS